MKTRSWIIKGLCSVATLGLWLIMSGSGPCTGACECGAESSCLVPVATPGVYLVTYFDQNDEPVTSNFTSDGTPIFIMPCMGVLTTISQDPNVVCNLMCPDDLNVFSRAMGDGFVPVKYDSPAPTNCPGDIVACLPSSGSSFGPSDAEAGNNRIECDAVNPTNQRIDAVCDFHIFVHNFCIQDDNQSQVYLILDNFSGGASGQVSYEFVYPVNGRPSHERGAANVSKSGNTFHLTTVPANPQLVPNVLTADFDSVAKKASATLKRASDGMVLSMLNDSNTDHGSCNQ